MRLIYQNFDGLDVAFQGAVSKNILSALEAAKLKAKESRQDVVIKLGPKQIPVKVAETGSRGGYAYRFDTGYDGAIWFIANSLDPQLWNIRVSAHSLNLALHRYSAVKNSFYETLSSLGAIGCLDNGALKERVSRVDYCFDFILSNFIPDRASFIAHPHCSQRVYEKPHESETVYKGQRIESIRIGTMPGRQIVIYDKIREIRVHNKFYWWDLWGVDKATIKDEIWRVEVRAGKDELDNWNIRRFADLEQKVGNVIAATLEAIRYTSPNSDSNRARWPTHPLWLECLSAAGQALAEHTSKASRKKIYDGLHADLVQRFQKMLRGVITSYTSLNGLDISELPTTLDLVAEDILSFARHNRDVITKKFQKAEDRYSLLKGKS